VKTLIKICGLSDAAMVDAAIDAGADAVGFVFAESVRQVGAREAAALGARVPEEVRKVAVMLHPTDAEWLAVMEIFQPDILQTDVADFKQLDVPDDIGRWPVMREGMKYAGGDFPPVFVYEGPSSGSGETVDWRQAERLARRGDMVLAGGLSADNVAEAIRAVSPYGVDVSSGVESAPGQKDIGKIREFIETVRAVESSTQEAML